MDRASQNLFATSLLALAALVGCNSPYHADRGALFGGLAGAGLGAVAGHALGNTAAGAAIGAGVGAISGAAVGSQMDEADARNRQAIAAQLGRQVSASAVSMDEVVQMVHAGVNEDLVITHVRKHGMARPLQTADLISLQSQGVSTRIIAAMQETPTPVQQPTTVVVRESAPPPVIVEEYHYGRPYYYGPPPYYYHHHPEPRVGWGVSISN
jgi:hypothetical protein